MKHKFVYQLNREYRCANCGLFADKDHMDAHGSEECPAGGDLLAYGAKIEKLATKQANLEKRLLVLERERPPSE